MTRSSYLALSLCACLTLVGIGCGGPKSHAPARSDRTEELVKLAESHQRARRYDRARAAYQKALDTAPDDRSRAYAAREYGLALVFFGEDREGERLIEMATRLSPSEPSSWHDLGVLRARRGDRAGAETALLRAIELAPGDARPRIAVAALWVNARRFGEAEAQYRAVLKLRIPDRIRRAIGQALELIAAEKRAGS